MNILGIETSCDETSAAVVRGGSRIKSNVVSSQIALHQAHGGVVPELAARGHVQAVIPVVQRAIEDAGIARSEIDAIAVTDGPGLAGSLLVGVNVAKALAYSLDRPLVAVNHLEGHIYANWLSLPDAPALTPPQFPLVCLLVSGGHSELILMTDHGVFEHLGRTLDDAAGEAFDKGARLLGLGYPGGPAIEVAAAGGDPARFPLPRAWLGESNDFSFSGLKTALLRIVAPYRLPDGEPASESRTGFVEHRPPRYLQDLPIADLAASFQAAIVDVLAAKAARVTASAGAKSFLVAGGVAANQALRERVQAEFTGDRRLAEVSLRFPPLSLCTDNAAMIAGAAFFALRQGRQAGWEVDVHPRAPLPVGFRTNG